MNHPTFPDSSSIVYRVAPLAADWPTREFEREDLARFYARRAMADVVPVCPVCSCELLPEDILHGCPECIEAAEEYQAGIRDYLAATTERECSLCSDGPGFHVCGACFDEATATENVGVADQTPPNASEFYARYSFPAAFDDANNATVVEHHQLAKGA